MTAREFNRVEYLRRLCESINKAVRVFRRSVADCQFRIDTLAVSDDDMDRYEAMTARFARLSDLLTQKLFRLLSTVELNEPGSTLDVLRYAVKIGLVASESSGRLIRELRNEISHEYAVREPLELARSVIEHSTELIESAERSVAYAQKVISELD